MNRVVNAAICFGVLAVVAGAATYVAGAGAMRAHAGVRLRLARPAAVAKDIGGKRTSVLVELFTSEGCSDCPPANELLTRLSRYQEIPGADIVPLSEHVDYFNTRAWSDPFSSAQFTARQDDYVRDFRRSEPYTPEMVVDGRSEFVGSDVDTAGRAIEAASARPHATVSITASEAGSDRVSLRIQVSGLSGAAGVQPHLFVAVTEDGLHSDVTGGENSGHRLSYWGVVRRLVAMRWVSSADGPFTTSVALDPSWRHDRLNFVAFLQNPATGEILGCGAAKLSS
jgi:hypothetical protein